MVRVFSAICHKHVANTNLSPFNKSVCSEWHLADFWQDLSPIVVNPVVHFFTALTLLPMLQQTSQQSEGHHSKTRSGSIMMS